RAVARLLPHAIGALSNLGWLKRIGAKEINVSPQGWFVAHGFRRIQPARDTELALSYAMFEGARQLPPVHVPHVDIATKGNGRYSIWNQSVFFSATAPGRLHKRPYWIAPINKKTERFLQMVPRVVQPSGDPKTSERAVERMMAEPASPGFM